MMKKILVRVAFATIGIALLILGAAAFGGVFEFIDAHRSMRPMFMLPVLLLWASAVSLVFGLGAAFVMLGVTHAVTPA
jgi:cell shape-determining protein MreD